MMKRLTCNVRHVLTVDRGNLIESIVFRIERFEVEAPASPVHADSLDAPLEIVGAGPGRITITGVVDFVEVTPAWTKAPITRTRLRSRRRR